MVTETPGSGMSKWSNRASTKFGCGDGPRNQTLPSKRLLKPGAAVPGAKAFRVEPGKAIQPTKRP